VLLALSRDLYVQASKWKPTCQRAATACGDPAAPHLGFELALATQMQFRIYICVHII